MKPHQEWLADVIKLAHENVDAGRQPYAGLVIYNGEAIGEGVNDMERQHDPTAHGEILAIREACGRLGTLNLSGAVLYASAQPCPMCLAAAYWAGIETIYYATSVDEYAPYMPPGPMDRFVADLAVPGEARAIPFVQLPVAGRLDPFVRWREQQKR